MRKMESKKEMVVLEQVFLSSGFSGTAEQNSWGRLAGSEEIENGWGVTGMRGAGRKLFIGAAPSRFSAG